MSLDLAILCRIATYRKELGEALRIGPKIGEAIMCHIRPLRGLGLSTKGLLSSVA